MKKEVLGVLNKLKLGDKVSYGKPLSDIEKEITDILYKLKNIGILGKEKNSFIVIEFDKLSKFIELKSIEKYIKWLNKPKLTYYQKIYLILSIVFGLLGLLSSFIYSPSKKELVETKNLLTLKIRQSDSLIQLNTKNIQSIKLLKYDTLQPRN